VIFVRINPFSCEVLLMLRALCLVMTILLAPVGYVRADSAADLGANAALKYWQAFATLPQFSDAESQAINADCLTMPLDAHARELVAKADYSLQMLHRGAAISGCEWAAPQEEGIYARFPQGPAARLLSALACLRARIRFEDRQNGPALDDAIAAMTLGRHVTRAETVIMLLVGYAVEHRTLAVLAMNLPRLDARMIADLKARLAALPSAMSATASLLSEERFSLDWFIRVVKEVKDKEALVNLLGTLEVTEGKPHDPVEVGRKYLAECGGTADGVLKFAEEMRPSYKLMAQKLELPLDQFQAEYDRETTKRSGNPVFKVFFPGLDKIRSSQARYDARRTLLQAALAVQVAGRDALKNFTDPIVGGPLEYSAFPGGFELRSKWKLEDKPVTLVVGQRGN
jgi:hypothetical protein